MVSGAIGLAAVSCGLLAHARHIAPYRPVVQRIALPLPPGHGHLAELTIGFLSDTHVGPSFSIVDLARACHLLASVRPDLVLLGGDYVSETTRYIDEAAPLLATLVRRAPLGGYAVLGNHDMHRRGEPVAAALRSCGIPVLRDRAARVDTGRSSLWVVGIDETLIARGDPAQAFAAVPPGAAALALWHEPDRAAEAARRGAFAQLSGHTHGGQIRLPRIGALVVPPHGRRFVIGLNHADGMPVYTSRGAGVYRPPLRFNCPPEVTLFTLTAGGAD